MAWEVNIVVIMENSCEICMNILADFMDALCDPRAFLSAQEKRAEQLKALGIEETDISGDVIESKGGDAAKKDEKGGKGGKKEEKKRMLDVLGIYEMR